MRFMLKSGKIYNHFRPVTVTARTTPGTHNPRISAKTVTNLLREMVKDPYICFICGVSFLTKYTSIYELL